MISSHINSTGYIFSLELAANDRSYDRSHSPANDVSSASNHFTPDPLSQATRVITTSNGFSNDSEDAIDATMIRDRESHRRIGYPHATRSVTPPIVFGAAQHHPHVSSSAHSLNGANSPDEAATVDSHRVEGDPMAIQLNYMKEEHDLKMHMIQMEINHLEKKHHLELELLRLQLENEMTKRKQLESARHREVIDCSSSGEQPQAESTPTSLPKSASPSPPPRKKAKRYQI